MSDLDINGTPTQVLVNRGGVVKRVWLGELPSTKENEVVTSLAQSL